MNFIPHTQEELQSFNIQNNNTYLIEYLDRDYFNGDKHIVKSEAKVIFTDEGFTFIVTDPYSMEKYINEVNIIKS